MLEEFRQLLGSPAIGLRWAAELGLRLLVALLIVAGARLAVRIVDGALQRWTDRRRAQAPRARHEQVLVDVGRGLARYGLYTVAALLVLNKAFSLSTASLITASGILGLAVSFGLQGFVRDFVSGLLLLMERAYAPGDLVEVAGQAGVVEEVGVRATRLRDLNGELRIIPNGHIGPVVNYPAGYLRASVTLFLPEDAPGHDGRKGVEEALRAVVRRLLQVGPFWEPACEVRWLAVPEAGMQAVQVQVNVVPLRRALIEQLLVPTLRDTVQALGLSLHRDRVVVHFEPAQPAGAALPGRAAG